MTKPMILIIEDQRDIADMYSIALSMAGFQTKLIHDGEAALAMLADELPALITLDVNLPGVGGHIIYERIRADERFRDVPVILATANTVMANMLASDMRDQDIVLVKPIGMPQLTRLARRLTMSQAS